MRVSAYLARSAKLLPSSIRTDHPVFLFRAIKVSTEIVHQPGFAARKLVDAQDLAMYRSLANVCMTVWRLQSRVTQLWQQGVRILC